MLKKIQSVLKNNSGFSFAELMVVIAIIGILSAVAVPAHLRSLPEKRLKNATRGFYADMQRARLLAVSENENTDVVFTTGAYTYGDRTMNLGDYGDISYGCGGGAINDWNDPPINWTAQQTEEPLTIIFTRTGSSPLNYDDKNENAVFFSSTGVDVCYAVSINPFGATRIWRQQGGIWQ